MHSHVLAWQVSGQFKDGKLDLNSAAGPGPAAGASAAITAVAGSGSDPQASAALSTSASASSSDVGDGGAPFLSTPPQPAAQVQVRQHDRRPDLTLISSCRLRGSLRRCGNYLTV